MVLVADLRARFSVDNSDLSRGAQQAKQDLAAVEQQAKATAAQLDELARRAAATNPRLGTPASFRSVFEAQNLTATQAAAMLGSSVGATPAAVQETTARDLERVERERMRRSQQMAEREARLQGRAFSSVRTGQIVGREGRGDDEGGAFGVSGGDLLRFGAAATGFGLGLSVAAVAGERLRRLVVESVQAERELEVAARATNAVYGQRTGGALAGAAGAFGADPNTRGNRTEYLQAATSLHDLTTESGFNTAQIQQAITAASTLAKIHGTELAPAAEAVGNVLRGNVQAGKAYELSLTDISGRIRGVNLSYDQLVEISGRTRANQVLLAASLQATAEQEANAKGSADELSTAIDRLGKTVENARNRLGDFVRIPLSAVVNEFNAILQGKSPLQQVEDFGFAQGDALARRVAPQIAGLLGGDQERRRVEVLVSAKDALEQLKTRQEEVERATQQAALAAVNQRTAIEESRAQMDATIASLQRLTQLQGQYATVQRALQGPDFGLGALAPGQAGAIGAAQAAQDVQSQRQQSVAQGTGAANAMRRQLSGAIDTARDIGPNAVAAAQQALDDFDRRADIHTRQVEQQHQAALAGMHVAEAQGALSALELTQRERGLALAQQTIVLHRADLELQRTNIALGAQVTQARLNALPAQNALSALGYEQQRTALQAQVIQARQLRGQDVSDLPTMDDLIRQNVGLQLDQPEVALRALDTNRAADVAQQQQTQVQLLQQLVQAPINQAQTVQDLANLNDLPTQLVLQQQLIDAQREQAATEKESRDLLKELVRLVGGSPGSSGVGSVVQQMISEGLATTSSAMSPASSGLAGARR